MTHICLAAGGTGGHMFPAAALAAELSKQSVKLSLITDQRGTHHTRAFPNIEASIVESAPMVGKGLGQRIGGFLKLVRGIIYARRLLVKSAPDIVVGFGGHPSVPPLIAAWLLGIPTILHEQNAVMGQANRLASRFAKKIALSFPDTVAQVKPERATFVGNPVRPEFYHIPKLTPSSQNFELLAFGGSLGAGIIADLVPSALATLSNEQRSRINLTIQLRPEDQGKAQATLSGLDLGKLDIQVFLNPMVDFLSKSHLVICRAGASTIAEIALAGRPALMIPLALHRDSQQIRNAKYLVQAGGGKILMETETTCHTLAKEISNLMGTPRLLKQMSDGAKAASTPNAARDLAEMALALMKD
ncbi:MAG: undecaprenyldiphospho-muramoylpentapeptide beta-N-acetylglucosaminyltransferase [Alphaproteobacteria bacterium]